MFTPDFQGFLGVSRHPWGRLRGGLSRHVAREETLILVVAGCSQRRIRGKPGVSRMAIFAERMPGRG